MPFLLDRLKKNLENDGLTEGRFVVDPRASITVTASADFEVKRTIHFVLLGSENRSQVFGHFNDCLKRKVYRIQ